MIKKKDLYTQAVETSLELDDGGSIGKMLVDYEIRQYKDMRNLSQATAYLVTCTQRILVANRHEYDINPLAVLSYEDYPVAIKNRIVIELMSGPEDPDPFLPPILVAYSPRTLNATVTADQSQTTEKGTSHLRESHTGSNWSQTNGYSFTASVGFFGEIPTGDFSGGYEHSETTGGSTDEGIGNTYSREQQASTASSMSIKDWGSYAIVDKDNQTATWIWAQEYPWDVIQFRTYDPETGLIVLPDFVQNRLVDLTSKPPLLFPPTQLSLFGVNFVAKATWLLRPKAPRKLTNLGIKFTHTAELCRATHKIDDNKAFSASLNVPSGPPPTFNSGRLDIERLALDPIVTLGADNGAVVGFVKNKFDVEPAEQKEFCITSGANNLLITGEGFSESASSSMICDLSHGEAKIEVYFKIIDEELELTLFMKHWKRFETGCLLKIKINDVEPISKHVDAKEGEGGDNNLTSVALRNKDYSSVDYYDYLKMGLNVVSITITGENGGQSRCGYVIRALAVA